MSWTERHLLDVEGLTREAIDTVFERAAWMRETIESRVQTYDQTELRGQHVALLFDEPSTRTRLSFELAARNLGAQSFVLDPPSSSMVKGESLADTCRNLSALGFDFVVLRHHRSGAPWVAARHFDGHVVNAGDGWHAHPTQALLDLLTLRRAWSSVDLDGRKVAIVGDARHSRVARSNLWTLTGDGAEVWLCGPGELLAGYEETASSLGGNGGQLVLTDDLRAALRDADAVMALRIQRERMGHSFSMDEYVERYRIDETHMALCRPGAFFLHPGPVNEGVEVTRDVATGPRSLVLEQVRNGVPLRMAVLSLLAGSDTSG